MIHCAVNKHLSRDLITGLIIVLLGIIGFLYTLFSEWGGGLKGAKLLPQICFLVLLLMGISLLAVKGEGEQPKGVLALMNVHSVLLFTGSGTLYFLFVLKIGLIVATVIYTVGIFSLLTVNPLKQWKKIIIPSAVITLITWILFAKIIVIILPNPLLF